MFEAGLLNLGSLLLGLVAWIFPVINLIQLNMTDNRSWIGLSLASVSTCAISLCLQIFYTAHLVKIEDWSALMDIAPTQILVATILLVVTIILNAITFFVYNGKTSRA